MSGRRRDRMVLGGLALSALTALSGCAGDTGPTACPQVLILADAERLTQYSGPGRDITDVELQGQVSGFRGTCERTKDGGLDVTVAVSFELQRGTADTDRVAAFRYFVALPDFYPAPEAKAVLPVQVAFPEGVETVRFVDEEVTLSIPASGDQDPASHDIYVGFQLDEAQLRHNRGQ